MSMARPGKRRASRARRRDRRRAWRPGAGTLTANAECGPGTRLRVANAESRGPLPTAPPIPVVPIPHSAFRTPHSPSFLAEVGLPDHLVALQVLGGVV